MKCDYLAWRDHPCARPATHQLVNDENGLAQVVPYDPSIRLARYCLTHAERLARHLNDSLTARETRAHHRGDPHIAAACAYCTPDDKRRLKIVREVLP